MQQVVYLDISIFLGVGVVLSGFIVFQLHTRNKKIKKERFTSIEEKTIFERGKKQLQHLFFLRLMPQITNYK